MVSGTPNRIRLLRGCVSFTYPLTMRADRSLPKPAELNPFGVGLRNNTCSPNLSRWPCKLIRCASRSQGPGTVAPLPVMLDSRDNVATRSIAFTSVSQKISKQLLLAVGFKVTTDLRYPKTAETRHRKG
jgi:hypothetical protein